MCNTDGISAVNVRHLKSVEVPVLHLRMSYHESMQPFLHLRQRIMLKLSLLWPRATRKRPHAGRGAVGWLLQLYTLPGLALITYV